MPVKVLVVEDELIVARTIATQLQQLGYTVTATASTAAKAITKAVETQPDLVLMDICLKGEMDGIVAAAEIRQQLNIPVVYLTAYADKDTLQQAKIAQPFGYIVKPFQENELRVAIEIALYRHEMERALQESQEQLATILRSMKDGVIVTDRQGTVTFINLAAKALTGWPQEEAIGQQVESILPMVDEATEMPVTHPVRQVLQTEEAVDLGDGRLLITKNGRSVPIGYKVSVLRQASGVVEGAVAVFWDISDRRQTEQLTRNLQKEREISSFRSQFISTVSHEFRNPLSAILIAAQLLQRYQNQATSEQKQRYLERIQAAVERMTDLMEDLLLIGQAESGRLEFMPTSINLEQFCRDLIAELSSDEEKFHRIVFTSQGNCTDAVMDAKLLRYILINLLANALKYSPGGETVQLDLGCNADERVAIFCIQDRGIGIPQEDQVQLFQSFYRAKNVGKIPGTGLGLAIVKACVDRHQGQISVTSNLGVGTAFTVTLPLDGEKIDSS
ncbi:MAG TPA: hybrid sensor histidine kinase/response regulator [Cyanobacteria bacterium UBA8803]|nr:hybrid sensor histidine kinase/response regulator [Cyanobacteria bacterium UBA9273]HBL62608.1 hybrid sensor histidine kinase/response regulator [Cyanobacteria bacterium UBA8803]